MENLAKIISKIDNQIEVIVVDNYSSDGTREYLKSLDIFPENASLRLILNSKNEGFNFSVDNIINQAKNDYLWIIGGHDQINLEGLKIVLKSLEAKPTYLIGNARIKDETSNSIINESLWGDLESQDFIGLDSFFSILGGPCQALSCNIFAVKKVQQSNNPNQLTKNWIFLERILDLLIANEDNLLIKFVDIPIVEMLIETHGWQSTGDLNKDGVVTEYGAFFTVLELTELVDVKFRNRREIIHSYPIWRDFFAIPRILIIAKSKGLPVDLRLVFRAAKVYKRSILFWIIGIPVLISPISFAKNLLKFKFLVHKTRKLFGIKTF
jgi:glycosyltransferase involved in cell wall biosynthesis